MSEGGGIKEVIPILFLTIVVCISVVLLVLTDSITRDLIEENEAKEIQEKLEDIFPEMADYKENKTLGVYIVRDDTGEIGVAFIVEGKGYGGVIKMLLGLDMNLSEIVNEEKDTDVLIKGMKIIPPISETPGLGAKIEEDSFQDQFKNKAVGDLELGEGIDGITGATISSKGVVNDLKKAAVTKIKLIKDKLGGEV